MSRRRPKSNLLRKTLIASIAINAVMLPILAQLGVLKKIQDEIAPPATVVLVPGAEEHHEEVKAKKTEAKPRASTAKAAGASVSKSTRSAPNPNAPKIVTSEGPSGEGPGTGDAPAVESGNGKAGAIPAPGPPTEVKKEAPPVKEERPPTVVTPAPEKAPEPKPVEKKAPVFLDAEPSYSPEPVIPDELREEDLKAEVTVLFHVDAEGHPTSVVLEKGSGNDSLDKIALDTAKKWRFSPAKLEGKATSTKIRLKMEFVVE